VASVAPEPDHGWYGFGTGHVHERAVTKKGTLMLTDFYIAFSPVCFSLLGLWLVVVQLNTNEWLGDEPHRRRAYGVALHFALPGLMSLLALVDPQNPDYWRVSFAIIALGGAAVLLAVRGLDGPVRLGHAVHAAGVVLYILIGVLAIIPHSLLREEAILLTVLVFLGFNVAWLLLSGQEQEPAHAPGGATAPTSIPLRDDS
jgi:hypothetical protein